MFVHISNIKDYLTKNELEPYFQEFGKIVSWNFVYGATHRMICILEIRDGVVEDIEAFNGASIEGENIFVRVCDSEMDKQIIGYMGDKRGKSGQLTLSGLDQHEDPIDIDRMKQIFEKNVGSVEDIEYWNDQQTVLVTFKDILTAIKALEFSGALIDDKPIDIVYRPGLDRKETVHVHMDDE